MSMIDPKGSRQELEALAIIRAHRNRSQNPPQEASLAANVKSPATIMLAIPGFWKSLANHIHAAPETRLPRDRDAITHSVQLILP